MTRIFDALRKAEATRGATHQAAPVTPMTAPASPHHTSPVGRAISSRPVPPSGPAPVRPAPVLPLALPLELSEDLLREMSTLRVGIESALGERTTRTLMFLSSQSGEGTSTVVAQFVRALSRDEQIRVLVVDAHARRPSIEAESSRAAAFFRLAGTRPGHTLPLEALAPAGNLDALPLPAEVIRAGAFSAHAARELLESVSSGYDWVVLDGPPVLESPDASGLAATADAVVVVVQAGRTKRPVLSRSVDLLRKAGARVLGTVLNRRRLEIPDFIYRRI